MSIRERLGRELLFFDGGMGTLLQERGLEPGELPEVWNLKHPEEVEEIHRRYFEAGSDIVLTNTFGANACKFHDDNWSLEKVICAAVKNARPTPILRAVRFPALADERSALSVCNRYGS